jgi:dihydrodipicolinate synthase/N-acetylneuraminate lyase
MKTTPVTLEDLQGVFAVPPLARKGGAGRALDLAANERLLRHMADGGLTRFLYGGNAFLYHVTLAEYAELIGWMSDKAGWMIPSVGPSFGRAMDQAPLVRRHRFPAVMALPCGDPRDAGGLEAGLREIAAAADTRLILYLKSEDGFGADLEAGLDAVARLVDDGTCVSIKYAVVRKDPAADVYLAGLLERVDRRRVVSGMGERPAVVHMKDFALPGFTTGSGCVAPALVSALYAACARADWKGAEELRALFMPLEDQRDEWGPARVLHAAVELAGVAATGPIPPFVTALGADRRSALEPASRELMRLDAERRGAPASRP